LATWRREAVLIILDSNPAAMRQPGKGEPDCQRPAAQRLAREVLHGRAPRRLAALLQAIQYAE
jgi:hypothetical protein